MSDEVIEGQVSAVLGHREVLINRGWKHGVKIGMRFAVLDEPVEIPLDDDATEAVAIRLPKTIVKIVRFEGDSASVGRTFRTVKGTPGFAVAAFGATEDRPERFEYDDTFELGKRDKVVRRGDPVRLTKGDEYSDDDGM
ncbi:hypothetical protein [Nocardia cyriacigeorgica]|uniref:hypothetical protein n=1 Tax=Nocardia cyriacigeorgica TaxID=135487 RepID=UPI00189557C3|nr:hypothetical protein [Nocardia cyriacigeorgica]